MASCLRVLILGVLVMGLGPWQLGRGSPALGRAWAQGHGVFSFFPLPHGSGPRFITRGPDGNIWFTENGKIGRVTMKGKANEFSLPGILELGGISAGPDHGVWFTEVPNFKVGRITPSGTVTEFQVPSSTNFAALGAIATGHDGRLWFAVNGANRIDRMTPLVLQPHFF